MASLQPRAGTAEVVEESIVLKVPSFLFYKFEQNFSVEFEVLLLNLSREMARRLHDSIVVPEAESNHRHEDFQSSGLRT